MELKRFLISMAAVTILTAILTACSSEEDEINNNEDICVSFRLLNEKGEETSTFKSGENLFFDLQITNNSNTTMVFSSERLNDMVVQLGISENGADMFFPLSSEDFFCVYDKEGRKIGVPYTGIYCSGGCCKVIESHSAYNARCNWKATMDGLWHHGNVTYPLCKVDSMDDLPIGEYYVSFSIKYRNKVNDPNSKFKTFTYNYPFTII